VEPHQVDSDVERGGLDQGAEGAGTGTGIDRPTATTTAAAAGRTPAPG